MHNWLQSNPQRVTALSAHANQIRANWAASPVSCFHGGWWIGRPLVGWRLVGWGYRPWLGSRAWWYWWGTPGWRVLAAWVVGWGWTDGYYYDYGPEGNVVIQAGQVAINGEVVGRR